MKLSVSLTRLMIAGLFILQIASVRRDEDPILKTQTNPIGYSEKMEETKDGQKEAPSPTFKLYPKEKFFVDSNLTDESELTEPKDHLSPEALSELPTDVAPEEVYEEPSMEEPQPKETMEAIEEKPGDFGEDDPIVKQEMAEKDDAWWFEESGEENVFKDSAKKT